MVIIAAGQLCPTDHQPHNSTLLSRRLFFIAIFWASAIICSAQIPGLQDGLKTYLTKDSSTWLRLNFVSQIWARYNDNNPGTTINGFPESSTWDVGIRRVRFVLSGQLTKRVFIFVQFGQNNLAYTSPRKTGAFFHDVTGEFALIPRKISIGFGLHGWNGPARFCNISVPNILALDPPVFQETTNDVNDQFVRKLGVYAKGKLGKLDYRVSMSKPFVTQTASSPPDPFGTYSSYSMNIPQQAFMGYFMYQFLDQENNSGPGTVGTYLGRKRIFNLGAGFVSQQKAMWYKGAVNDTIYHPMNLWAVDVFYDAPINRSTGTALTVYAAHLNYDFGPGYIRNVGPMNPGVGVKNGSFNGTGNAAPLIGTGPSWYLLTGYKLRNGLFGELGTLQFYSSLQYSKYDRLKYPVALFDIGVNWLIHGQGSKFTLNYQSRPVYSGVDQTVMSRKGEWVLQYQIAF